jgi:long-chain acyl-CoA synthetase
MQQPEAARALAVVQRAAKKRSGEVHPQDNLELDLGLDSMERVELLVELERELTADVDDAVVSEVYTVRDLVDAVRARAGAGGARVEFGGWDAVLATESSDPEVLLLAKPRRVLAAFWFLAGRILNLLCRDLCQLRVTGLEKLPQSGPFILCPNHQSFLDAPVVASLLPWHLFKSVFHLGTSEIWGWGWRRRLARSLRLVPVDPDSNLVAGMRAGTFGLRRGHILTLYPEGERSIDGTPRTFKKGAAILATHLKVPIYPVALDGFHEAWPRGKPPQKFARLRVAFGDPILPPAAVGSANPEATYQALTAELRRRVVEMWESIREPKPQEKVESSRAAAAD